jgi:hypothetical protein
MVWSWLVQAVGEWPRWLVDDPQHLEAGDLSRLLGGLALRVPEVRRDRDHSLGDRATEIGLGVALQLHQDPGTDLLGGVVLAVDVDGPRLAHMPLDRADRAIRVGDRLARDSPTSTTV